MSVEWRGNEQLMPRLRMAVTRGLDAYMVIVGRALRAQLSQAGTGRLYPRGSGMRRAYRRAKTAEAVEKLDAKYRGRKLTLRQQGWHRASAAGKPPAVDTGMLRRSWQVGQGAVVRKYSRDAQLGVVLGSPLKYARIEYPMGRVKARPYIRPTIKAVGDLFEPTMARAIKSWGGSK